MSDKRTSAWYARHVSDAFVKKAQKEGKRSRAVFKLTEILDKHGLRLRAEAVVVDLGCAPGSWCQEMSRRIGPQGLLVGIDLLPLSAIAGVRLIQADFTSAEGLKSVQEALSGRSVDLVLSDMAPEMSGNKLVDQARMMGLNDATLTFAVNHLREGGDLLLKSFMGDGYDAFKRELAGWFATVKTVKPEASRKTSGELFLLAQGFRRK